jgi:hypothetical protein
MTIRKGAKSPLARSSTFREPLKVDLSSAPIDVQADAFERMVLSNPVVATILDRLPQLRLPDCYLAAGALFQTVWNCLTHQAPTAGIKDYDINYFDSSDTSWDAEDTVIRRTIALFRDLRAEIEVRNEARVHLWYEAKYGVPCPPYTSTAAAISSFPNASSCFGVRPGAGRLEIYAPFGFSDLFALRTRPNPVLAPRSVYEAKTSRWRQEWPQLQILPWPEGESHNHPHTQTGQVPGD